MDIENILIKNTTSLFLAGTLIVAFATKPQISGWKKSTRLLLPILTFLIISTVASKFSECFPYRDNGCWSHKLFFFTLMNLFFIMVLGWCEITWRHYHKLTTWPLKENLKHGVIGNAVLLISFLFTLAFIPLFIFNL